MSWLDRIQGLVALAGGIALLVSAALALVAGEFSTQSRIALGAAILLLGSSIAINPERAWQAVTRRESIYSSNAVLLSAAFVGILVLMNVLAVRFHYRWDLTAQRDFTLSDATLKVLEQLPAPVHATAFFSGNLSDRQKTQDLLKEYETRSSGKLTWEMVDTFVEPFRADLAGVRTDGTVQFRMGERKQDTITSDESHLTTALIKLVNPTPLKVYYVVGHGERELERFDDEGYSELATQLRAENYILETLNLFALQSIPEDARAVIIASPRSPFLPEELAAINKYLDGKGKLVLLVDPLRDEANVDEVIKRWDLSIGKGVVIEGDPQGRSPQDPTLLIVARYGFHAIVKDLGTISVMPLATSIEIPNLIKRGVEISGLAQTLNDRSWLEMDRGSIQFDDGVDKKGPLTVAVAVEEAENPELLQETLPGFQDPNKKVKNRAVIFGTSAVVINGLVKLPTANRDLFLNSLNWVTETDQLITTRPRIEERRTLFLTGPQSNFVLYSSAVFFPLLLLGVAAFIWWARR